MTFANPWAFLLLPLLIPLILLYLFKEEERRLAVPSLLFWKHLEQRNTDVKSVRMKRFISDPMFWLQLLILLCIIGTIAEPVIQTSVRKVVLIMDVSASMQTRENGGSRMDLARSEAHGVVSSLAETDQIAIITAGIRPERILDFTMNKSLALARINNIKALDTTGRMNEAVSLATTMAGEDDRLDVVVISDQTTSKAIASTAGGTIRIHDLIVGETDVNVGFVAFHPRSELFSGSATGDLMLRNYRSNTATGRMTIRQDDRLLMDEQVELPPGGTVPLILESFDNPSPVEVVFDTADSLDVDNRAFFLPITNQRNTIQVFTNNQALIALLQQLEDFEITAVSQPGIEAGKSFDVHIYDGMIPSVYPSGGVVVLAPYDPSRPLPGRTVYDWSPEHPVLRDLVLERISLSGAALIDNPPAWAEVIARTQEHPVILAGEVNKSRRIILAPDLIRQKESPAALLLLLKAITWVNPGLTADRRQISAGNPFMQSAVPDTGEVLVTAPSGQRLPVIYQDGGWHISETVETGIYTIQTRSGTSHFAANLFNEFESDIRPGKSSVLTGSMQLDARAVIDTAYWRWGLWFVMGAILLGWIYEIYRPRVRS